MTDSEVGALRVGQIIHVDLAYACTEAVVSTAPRKADEIKFSCWARRGAIVLRITYGTPGLHLPSASCKRAPSPSPQTKGRVHGGVDGNRDRRKRG